MALTRMGAWGVSMRRTTFTGVEAEAAPLPVQVTRGGGSFLDIPARTEHIERVRIILEDTLIVRTDEKVISPPQEYVEEITILLWDQIRISTDEQVIDGADRRRAKRIALKWFGLNNPSSDTDPWNIL